MHIAVAKEIHDYLLPGMEKLLASIASKSQEFKSVIKVGRTHAQVYFIIRLQHHISTYCQYHFVDKLCFKSLSNISI